MKHVALALLLLSSPAIAQTPCDIAIAYRDEMDTSLSERRAARINLSSAISDAATKATSEQMAYLLSLVIKMATADAKSYRDTSSLREALRNTCP